MTVGISFSASSCLGASGGRYALLVLVQSAHWLLGLSRQDHGLKQPRRTETKIINIFSLTIRLESIA